MAEFETEPVHHNSGNAIEHLMKAKIFGLPAPVVFGAAALGVVFMLFHKKSSASTLVQNPPSGQSADLLGGQQGSVPSDYSGGGYGYGGIFGSQGYTVCSDGSVSYNQSCPSSTTPAPPTQPNSPGTACTGGQVMNSNGVCVLPITQCPPGQVQDSNGNCGTNVPSCGPGKIQLGPGVCVPGGVQSCDAGYSLINDVCTPNPPNPPPTPNPPVQNPPVQTYFPPQQSYDPTYGQILPGPLAIASHELYGNLSATQLHSFSLGNGGYFG